MTTEEPEISEVARLWALRVQDSAFDDWSGLVDWLESDPGHLAAYEAAVDVDDWAGDLFRHQPPQALFVAASEPAAMPRAVSRPRRWYAVGGAIAATIVAVATFATIGLNAPTEIVTAPGEHRTIPLADGSRIRLNGGTRLLIDEDSPRAVELASGEALFEIRHDESDPFVVTVGDTRLVDAGTVFNVISERGALDVAVAEGAVIYRPGADEIRLAPGDALSRADSGSAPVLRKMAPQAVGGWQTGRLVYSNASLAEVARDLGRNIGTGIRVAGGAERLRFTGTLAVSGADEQVLSRAGPLLGVDFAPDGNGWRMTPANGAPPY